MTADSVQEYARPYTSLEGFQAIFDGNRETVFFIFTSECPAIMLGYGPRRGGTAAKQEHMIDTHMQELEVDTGPAPVTEPGPAKRRSKMTRHDEAETTEMATITPGRQYIAVDAQPFEKLNRQFLEEEGYCVVRLPSKTELSSAELARLKQTMRARPVQSVAGSTAELIDGAEVDQRRHFMALTSANLKKLEDTTRMAMEQAREIVLDQLRVAYGGTAVRTDGVLILAEDNTAMQVSTTPTPEEGRMLTYADVC